MDAWFDGDEWLAQVRDQMVLADVFALLARTPTPTADDIDHALGVVQPDDTPE